MSLCIYNVFCSVSNLTLRILLFIHINRIYKHFRRDQWQQWFSMDIYSLDTQIMLVLILIDVQYSQKAVLSFEKGSNCQNHYSWGSLHPVNPLTPPPTPPPVEFLIPPTPDHYLENPGYRGQHKLMCMYKF